MNLYRSFGNLFENWVTEGSLDLHSGVDGYDLTGSNSVSRNLVSLSSVKSVSEDSGFETVSTTSPCHSHQESLLANSGIVSLEDDVQPAPSVCSSSSSSVSLGSVAPRNTSLYVEEALRRSEQTSQYFTSKGPLHQIDNCLPSLLYRCHTVPHPSGHTTNSREHHGFSRPRRTNSERPDHKKAELYRRRISNQYGQPVVSQVEFEEGEQRRSDKLSPGLLYLEQVCRMLENIATLQQQNHSLQKELEILKSQHVETDSACSKESKMRQRLEILAHEDSSSLSTLSEEPVAFRYRSASDTRASIGRNRRARFAQDESFAGVVFEEPDSNISSPGHDTKKPSKIQKLKFTSFRKQETQKPHLESNSDQHKKKTKLPSIFNRRRTTRL
ncbi:uncharacterized protein [Misgurnus anguillicaudatus]|uniref:uncharacterized protein n=1 Tax=Misgurnus anguillicaudatus TaxID=75329 RepID=UPI00243519F4|nr:uncharacterized protein si:dkey-106l3.7 [Misgurnus anguillicaudatus]